MFLKPDYNLKSIYQIDLDELKAAGINALLFDLDSTLMGSKTGFYSQETLNWLEKVKKDFLLVLYQTTIIPNILKKSVLVQIFQLFLKLTSLIQKLQKSL